MPSLVSMVWVNWGFCGMELEVCHNYHNKSFKNGITKKIFIFCYSIYLCVYQSESLLLLCGWHIAYMLLN